jgi:hypothetical protein
MSAKPFPSISSLLNSPASSCGARPSHAEKDPKLGQASRRGVISFMSNSTAEKPAAQHVSYRDLFSPQSSTHGSSNSLSTVIGSLSPRSSHFKIPPLVSINEDQTTKYHQLPNSCFEGDPFGIFSRNAGSTNAPQYPSYGHLGHQTSSALPQFVLIDLLRRICTTCALKFYHSLLPPPTVYVTVHQDHPESRDSGSHLHFKTITECFPNHSPQTAQLCGEALSDQGRQ